MQHSTQRKANGKYFIQAFCNSKTLQKIFIFQPPNLYFDNFLTKHFCLLVGREICQGFSLLDLTFHELQDIWKCSTYNKFGENVQNEPDKQFNAKIAKNIIKRLKQMHAKIENYEAGHLHNIADPMAPGDCRAV